MPLGEVFAESLSGLLLKYMSSSSFFFGVVSGVDFSGDFVGDRPPSMNLLRSLTCPVCNDCMRL